VDWRYALSFVWQNVMATIVVESIFFWCFAKLGELDELW